MSNLLVLGNDKIGGLAFEKLFLFDNLHILVDRSTNAKRILKLLQSKRIQLGLVVKMFWAELVRKGCKPPRELQAVKSNADLRQQINQASYEKIYLFRAGLIINQSVIRTGLKILNVHAAKVPEYGGIGSINRALNEEAYDQYASLHVVTSKIDDGQVLDKEPFTLDSQKSYLENEQIAYDAAICLLLRSLKGTLNNSESF